MGKVVLVFGVVIVLVLLIAGGSAFILMSPAAKPTTSPTTNQLTPTSPTASPQQEATVNQIVLTITFPQNNATVTNSALQVVGQTAPNADVSINDVDIKADAKGAFTANLTLSEGDNPIYVTAVDADGNYSETEITVTYQAPE